MKNVGLVAKMIFFTCALLSFPAGDFWILLTSLLVEFVAMIMLIFITVFFTMKTCHLGFVLSAWRTSFGRIKSSGSIVFLFSNRELKLAIALNAGKDKFFHWYLSLIPVQLQMASRHDCNSFAFKWLTFKQQLCQLPRGNAKGLSHYRWKCGKSILIIKIPTISRMLF